MGLFDKLFKKKETEKIEEQVDKEKEIVEKEENQKVNISQRLTKSKEGFFSKLCPSWIGPSGRGGPNPHRWSMVLSMRRVYRWNDTISNTCSKMLDTGFAGR